MLDAGRARHAGSTTRSIVAEQQFMGRGAGRVTHALCAVHACSPAGCNVRLLQSHLHEVRERRAGGLARAPEAAPHLPQQLRDDRVKVRVQRGARVVHLHSKHVVSLHCMGSRA